MLFQRFLKRRKAAADATTTSVSAKNQDALNEQALHHVDAARRQDAIRQVTDPAIVRQILEHDHDAAIREAATARLRALLCAPLEREDSLDALLDGLTLIEDLDWLGQIAIHGHLARTRRAAIERLDSPSVLAECAVKDPLAANRGLAVERLSDKAALEEVARRIGKRDKNVYRTAREKLRLIAEQEELPLRIRAQCEDLCAKAQRLGRLGHWTQDRALLEHLDRQWADIQAHVDPEWQARFTAERERFLAAHAAHCHENANHIADQATQDSRQAEAEALLDALSRLPGTLDEAELAAACERIALAWAELPPLPDRARKELEQRYVELMRAARAAGQAFASQRDRAERLRKTIVKAERLLEGAKPLDHHKVEALLAQGQGLADSMPDSDPAKTFQSLAARLESRLNHQHKHAEQRLKQFAERLPELEAHLTAGELRKADPLFQSLTASLDLIQASGIHKREETELGNRLRALAPRLRELQHWRRWGADQHREGLCAEMEALLERDLPLAHLAEQLHTLQMDWKSLDKTGSPANQAFWERFHTASDAVYARCRPHVEAQAAEREANQNARERVCQQIEEFLAKVDWERVDWKKTLRAERDLRQTWGAIGPTEGRQRKLLERRFHQSLRQLDQRLDAERKRNQALKHGLIERVEALAELPDLDAAIEQTKALQREWRTTVPARQQDENKLWQRFRSSCDAVFERRAAVQQAHASELSENLAAREAICREVSELAASESDPKHLATVQRELMDRWRATESLPIPRHAAAQLARRWQEARDALERHGRMAEERGRLATLELLKHQAGVCQRLELGLLGESGDAADPAGARSAWEQLPEHADGELQKAMVNRYDLALAATEDAAKLERLRRRRAAADSQLERLCLQLEIIAGIESPPGLAQQRLELQVARLTERMVAGEEDPLQGATQLLHDWYLHGPAPRNDGLNTRFDRVRLALLNEQPSEASKRSDRQGAAAG